MLAKHNAEGVGHTLMEDHRLNAAALREIRAHMARNRMTQEQLAAQMVPQRGQPYVQRRLSGKVGLTLMDIEEIADALGVPALHLLAKGADA